MHRNMGWVTRLAVLRLAAQWRSILTIIVGVLLAAVIGASAPLYTAAVAQVGLVQRLEQSNPAEINIHTRTSLGASEDANMLANWAALDAAFNDSAADAFDWSHQTINWAESANLFLDIDGEAIEDIRIRAAYYDNLADEAELVAGTWPDDMTGDGPLEIALPAEAANIIGLDVGDELILDQRGWESSQLIPAQVTALIQPSDPQATYWMNPSPLRVESGAQWRLETNFLTTRANIERISVEYIPETSTQFGWRVLFDTNALPFSRLPGAVESLNSFAENIDSTLQAAIEPEISLVYQTELPQILDSYRDEVTVLNVPFNILLLQLGALVLFFLVVMSALVRRSERREVAMMQSRGALDNQILFLRGMETLLICLAATLVAPFIAQQLLVLLIPLFTGIQRLPLEIDASAYSFAGGAALVALVALMATLVPILRQPLVSAGNTSRVEKQTWWQRYYLDLVLLLIGLGALWRLTTTDSPLTETQIGEAQADPLLLIGPAFLFFALGSVSLRLFPAVMRLAARFFSGRNTLAGVLAGWQVSREPLHYGRITFLLALAISIGWFAISFQSTLARSQSDQAEYAVGADVRLAFEEGAPPASTVTDTLDGIAAISAVQRLDGTNISASAGRQNAPQILAVDNETITEAAYWRDDLGSLTAPVWEGEFPQEVTPLPAGARQITFQASLMERGITFIFDEESGEQNPLPFLITNPLRLIRSLEITFTLQNQVTDEVLRLDMLPDTEPYDEFLEGNVFALGGAQLPNLGWVSYTGDLSTLQNYDPDAEYEINGITFRYDTEQRGFGNLQSIQSLYLSDPNVIDGAGDPIEVNWFMNEDWDFGGRISATEAQGPNVHQIAPGETATGNALSNEQFFEFSGDTSETQSTEFEVELIREPQFGTVELAEDGTYTYTPGQDADDFVDTFGYRATDAEGGQGFGYVSVTVTPPGNVPNIETALPVHWTQAGRVGTFGLLLNQPELITLQTVDNQEAPEEIDALPIAISRRFAEINDLILEQQFPMTVEQVTIWFEVAEIIDYYPTVYDAQRPFIVMPQRILNYTLRRSPDATTSGPNELWVQLEDGTTPAEFLNSYTAVFPDSPPSSTVTLTETLDGLQTDLLTLGLIGLLFFSFLVGMALSIVSLLTYASLTVQSRRLEFSVLRAMGWPLRRVVFSMTIEQALVVAIAIGIGAVIGFFLSTQVLPTLSLSSTGAEVTPPFLIRTEAGDVLAYGLILLAILITELVVSALLVRRLATGQVTRME